VLLTDLMIDQADISCVSSNKLFVYSGRKSFLMKYVPRHALQKNYEIYVLLKCSMDDDLRYLYILYFKKNPTKTWSYNFHGLAIGHIM
jgi:hypothetical protein